jgi:hypothetical protein
MLTYHEQISRRSSNYSRLTSPPPQGSQGDLPRANEAERAGWPEDRARHTPQSDPAKQRQHQKDSRTTRRRRQHHNTTTKHNKVPVHYRCLSRQQRAFSHVARRSWHHTSARLLSGREGRCPGMSEGQEENEDEERRYAKVRVYYCTGYTILYCTPSSARGTTTTTILGMPSLLQPDRHSFFPFPFQPPSSPNQPPVHTGTLGGRRQRRSEVIDLIKAKGPKEWDGLR